MKRETAILNEMDILTSVDMKKNKRRRHRVKLDQPEDNRFNLIDRLYNNGCISVLHKQHIEQQPDKLLKNNEMFQLIKNGSIKTFKLVDEYFRQTEQRNVVELLNKKYDRNGKRAQNWLFVNGSSRVT